MPGDHDMGYKQLFAHRELVRDLLSAFIIKRDELGAGQRLPPVLPLVLYNGSSPWNACDELRELVGAVPSGLEQFQASQRYLLIDQRRLDAAGLEASRSMMAVLFRLELERSSKVLKEAAATLTVWLCGEAQAALRRSIAAWIAHLLVHKVDGVTIDEIESLLEGGAMGERFLNEFSTWEDTFVARGREEGREEGRQLLRAVLKRQISKRFGDIPAAALARIEAAGEDELERWSERIVDAGSLAAVLAD